MDGTSSLTHSQSVNVSGIWCWCIVITCYVQCRMVSKNLQDFLVEKKLKKVDAKVLLSLKIMLTRCTRTKCAVDCLKSNQQFIVVYWHVKFKGMKLQYACSYQWWLYNCVQLCLNQFSLYNMVQSQVCALLDELQRQSWSEGLTLLVCGKDSWSLHRMNYLLFKSHWMFY